MEWRAETGAEAARARGAADAAAERAQRAEAAGHANGAHRCGCAAAARPRRSARARHAASVAILAPAEAISRALLPRGHAEEASARRESPLALLCSCLRAPSVGLVSSSVSASPVSSSAAPATSRRAVAHLSICSDRLASRSLRTLAAAQRHPLRRVTQRCARLPLARTLSHPRAASPIAPRRQSAGVRPAHALRARLARGGQRRRAAQSAARLLARLALGARIAGSRQQQRALALCLLPLRHQQQCR